MKQLNHLLIISILFIGHYNYAQNNKDSELFNILKANDSLMFDIGFNTCDFSQFEYLIADDLEFYHDKSGVINTKSEFINVMKSGICNPSNTFIARRELIKGSLEIFPLYNNGVIYGAIQTGDHRFFEKNGDQPEKAGSIAKFTHLWILENNLWKLKRVLSYDHKI